MTDPRLRAKVLVVDDNVDFCNMLASELSQRYDVVTANSGEEALTKLGESIDAVVTDVRMPNMDGIGLIKRIKGRDPEMTVVAMTAESSIEDADSVHRAGAVQYIVKNIGRGGMAKLVEKLYPIIEPRVWARISDFNFTESRKVLVVDSSDRVGGVRRACGEHAAKLLQASSYSEVYTAFQHARIGLVLLNARPDTHNTSYDGAEIARTIRRTYPFTNIVAYGTRAGEDAATELLFAKTASRAFNKDELLRNIGDVIQENFNARKWRVEKHLNMYPPGFWAIAGCRTSGKSLIINGLMAALPWLFKHKSITSRQKREGETDSDHIFESESYIKNLPDKRYLKYTYAEDFYAHDTARYTNEFDLSGKDIVVPVTNPLVLPEVQKMFLRVKQDQVSREELPCGCT